MDLGDMTDAVIDDRFCQYVEVTREGSQFGEDEIIADLLTRLPAGGHYIDIGASHPIECSNTWRLYQRGMRGLLIEPNPMSWFSLSLSRPEDYLVPFASSDKQGYLELCSAAVLSSVREDWPAWSHDRFLVRCEPLYETLERFPSIRDNCRVCSIDVEGHEREALLGCDFSTFRPDIFVVEYRWYNPDAFGVDVSGEWAWILANNGYWQYKSTELNQIWLKG